MQKHTEGKLKQYYVLRYYDTTADGCVSLFSLITGSNYWHHIEHSVKALASVCLLGITTAFPTTLLNLTCSKTKALWGKQAKLKQRTQN